MKITRVTETNDIEISTETESLTASTPGMMSEHEVKISPTISVTSEEVTWQIRAITNPLTQPFSQLCELMCELNNEQANRCYEGSPSIKADSSASGSTDRSESHDSLKHSLPHNTKNFLLCSLRVVINNWETQWDKIRCYLLFTHLNGDFEMFFNNCLSEKIAMFKDGVSQKTVRSLA